MQSFGLGPSGQPKKAWALGDLTPFQTFFLQFLKKYSEGSNSSGKSIKKNHHVGGGCPAF